MHGTNPPCALNAQGAQLPQDILELRDLGLAPVDALENGDMVDPSAAAAVAKMHKEADAEYDGEEARDSSNGKFGNSAVRPASLTGEISCWASP